MSAVVLGEWLRQQTDARPLALFRIGLGFVLLQDIALWSPDFSAFLTDAGIRQVQHAAWYDWSLFHTFSTLPAAALLHAVGALASLAFLVGFQTRWASVACWLFFMSLANRNRELSLGGDYLVCTLLFWSMFSDLGGVYSLDARRYGPRALVPGFGAKLLRCTPALLYLEAALYKLRLGSGGWLQGPALFQTLQLDGWVRPLGAVLRQYPELCALLGSLVLCSEFLFAPLALSPIWQNATRACAIALNVGIQSGILLTMKVGIFTDLMLVVSLLYLRPTWIDKLLGEQRAAELDRPATPPLSWLRTAGAGLVLALFVVSALLPLAARRFPPLIHSVISALGIELKVDLYSRGYPVEAWSGHGQLRNGAPTEVIRVAAPGLVNGVGWRFSRWTALVGRAGVHYPELGEYLCREYARRRPQEELDSFTVVSTGHDPPIPGQPLSPTFQHMLFVTQCRSASPGRAN